MHVVSARAGFISLGYIPENGITDPKGLASVFMTIADRLHGAI